MLTFDHNVWGFPDGPKSGSLLPDELADVIFQGYPDLKTEHSITLGSAAIIFLDRWDKKFPGVPTIQSLIDTIRDRGELLIVQRR